MTTAEDRAWFERMVTIRRDLHRHPVGSRCRSGPEGASHNETGPFCPSL